MGPAPQGGRSGGGKVSPPRGVSSPVGRSDWMGEGLQRAKHSISLAPRPRPSSVRAGGAGCRRRGFRGQTQGEERGWLCRRACKV